MTESIRFAYADPPYLGCGKLYKDDHADAADCDDPEWHRNLIDSLDEYDAWALSLSASTLYTLLPMCPPDVRVCAWVKPFASFKPNVNPGFVWEPVIIRGGRKLGRKVPTVRDWFAASITLKRGLTGAKPEAFCFWLFQFVGLVESDDFCDLFPGTGSVGAAWNKWCNQTKMFI